MSLRWRLALILAGTVAVTVTFASVGAYLVTATELQGESERFLYDRGKQVVAQLSDQHRPGDERGGGGRGPGWGQGPPAPSPSEGQASVFDQPDALVQYVTATGAGETYANSGVKLPITSADRDVAAGKSSALLRDVTQGDQTYRVYTVPVDEGAAVQIARDVTGTGDVLAGLRARMILLGVAGTAVAAAVGWLVARHTVRPVERLTAATEKIAATQELAESFKVDRRDEVGRLAESFNAMLHALSTARMQQQRLVQDASHELRTPLTSLRTNIEVLASADQLDPHDRARLIDDVGLELVELTDLVNELVVLAQANSSADEPPVEVRFDEVVAAAVERARRRTGRTIQLDSSACSVEARPVEIDRAVANLLSNATKFSPSSTPIDVRVRAGRVEVRDHGAGFDERDLPHIFERFYRSEAARSAPGSGLGLSIVEQVVAEHGGTVFAENAAGGGALVGFQLPPPPRARVPDVAG
ncbi:MAG: HAMP domain-containing histidine kinase [Actinobacteria bacterium]|nr:HAMP domain-containing histidine kinase [Actinomycetota bacterium]